MKDKDKDIIVLGGEENLLAYFLLHARSFDTKELTGLNMICFTGGMAEMFEKNPKVKIRLAEEKKHFPITESIIQQKRNSTPVSSDKTLNNKYSDLVLSLFLSFNSLEKRLFGKFLVESANKAKEIDKVGTLSDNNLSVYRTYYSMRDTLFIFVFLGHDSNAEDLEIRVRDLEYSMLGAAKKMNFEEKYIIGIGMPINFRDCDEVKYDWGFLDVSNKDNVKKEIDTLYPELDMILNRLMVIQDTETHVHSQNEYEKTELDLDISKDIEKYKRTRRG